MPIGRETVLLVEDDDGVRALAYFTLKQSGYAIVEANHGAEAIELARRHEGPIQLLVCDVMMPEMAGHQVARAVSESHPDIKVLYLSGYSAEFVLSLTASGPPAAFLQKPFTTRTLVQKIREVLS